MLVGQSFQQDEVDFRRPDELIIWCIDQISGVYLFLACATFWRFSTLCVLILVIFLRDTVIRHYSQVQLKISLDFDQKLCGLLYVILVGPAARVPIVEPILLGKHIPAAYIDVTIHVPIEMPGETN